MPTKNTRDRATEILPRLLYERLDEFGMDFTVLYPTAGLGIPFHPDDETRRATCRAFNRFIAEFFGEFSDRMTPAAVIPMHTPEEACAELEYVVKELGLKVVMMASMVRRRDSGRRREVAGRGAIRDLVRRARARQRVRLRSGVGEMRRAGNLADVPFGLARHRAAQFADQFCLQPHRPFRRRERGGLQGDFHGRRHAPLSATQDGLPRRRRRMGVRALQRSDRALEEAQSRGARGNESGEPESRELAQLIREYGGKWVEGKIEQKAGEPRDDSRNAIKVAATGGLRELDDYAACGIKRAEDIRDCSSQLLLSAAKPMTAQCLRVQSQSESVWRENECFVRLGYWDISTCTDMKDVVPEAYEMLRTS